MHRVPVKKLSLYLCECRPIFAILSPRDSQDNSLCIFDRNFCLTLTMLLHYLTQTVWELNFKAWLGFGTSSRGVRRSVEANDAKTSFCTLCSHPAVQVWITSVAMWCGGFVKTTFTRTRSRTWKNCSSAPLRQGGTGRSSSASDSLYDHGIAAYAIHMQLQFVA